MFSKNTLSFAGLLLGLAGIAAGLLNVSLALALGLVLALVCGNPWRAVTSRWSGWLLKSAVVGLGFGLPLDVVLGTAMDSLLLTVATIVGALGLGFLLTRLLRVDSVLGQLLSVGTAICGGSAIAAVAPVLKAKHEQIALSLAVVFLLNGLGLWLFPPIGQWLALSDQQFALWAALAIHDTSSVVGAAATFSDAALPLATTVKLARAVWIVPLVLAIGFWRRHDSAQASVPMFMALFLAASLLRTLIPEIAVIAVPIMQIAKHLFAISLFLIGYGLTAAMLRQLNWKPVSLALILWLVLASGSLLAVTRGWY